MGEKMLTGYPSIDKPWLKYYSEGTINAQLPACTITIIKGLQWVSVEQHFNAMGYLLQDTAAAL